MIVKDLLAMCNIEKLLECIAEIKEYPSVEAVAERYLPVLEELERISPDPDKEQFVLGMKTEDGVTVMCFAAPMVRTLWGGSSFWERVSEEELLQSDCLLDVAAIMTCPKGYCFYLIPWQEVLAMYVSAENIRQIGAEQMSAHILTDMTDSGFSLAEAEEHLETVTGLLSASKYGNMEDSLKDLMARMSNRAPTEEELLARKRQRALTAHRNYHLLKEYADLWKK